MHAGIISPCAVPRVLDGTERLYWGLARCMNEHMAHLVHIIKPPTQAGLSYELAVSRKVS